MENIAVSDLRANLMKVLKTIEKGSTVNITSRGKVVALLVPPKQAKIQAEKKLAELRKTAKIHDAISPISEHWKVDS